MILTKAKNRALEQKSTVDWQTVDRDWQQYLDEAGSGWRERFIPLMEGIIVDQGNDWNLQMGMEFDVRNLFAEKWFDDYTMQFANNTAEGTREGMTGLLKQAMEEGWGIPNMQNNLGQMFDQWMYGGQSPADFEWLSQRMPAYRLEMIARTETIRASNRGSNQLFAAWGVEEKEWLTTKDDRLCDWCAAMDGKIISVGGNFFDQGSQFNVQVGGVTRMLKLDYEDVSTPPLHPDCRCTILPVVGAVRQLGPEEAAETLWESLMSWAEDDRSLEEVEEIMQQYAAQALANRTGISESNAKLLLRKWAETSADADADMLLSQIVAGFDFDIPLSEYITNHYARYAGAAGGPLQLDSGQLESFLRAMYETTQESLSELGIPRDGTIKIYRGIRRDLDEAGDWVVGDTITPRGNPLESWSFDRGMAANFAEDARRDQIGFLLEMDVPVRDAFSLGYTGFGVGYESEIVILGRYGQIAEIVERSVW